MLSSVASGGEGKNPYAVLPESKIEFSGVGGIDDDSPQAREARSKIQIDRSTRRMGAILNERSVIARKVEDLTKQSQLSNQFLFIS